MATFLGTSGDDTLIGGNGDDILIGGTGDDTIDGGGGNDSIWGQEDDDSLLGGDGDDLIFGLEDDDIIDGGSGNDIVLAGTGDDRVFNAAGDDRIWGEAGRDTLTGGSGNEFLAGGSDDDLLRSGAGNDYLWGEEGDDTLYGGSGANTLAGGTGNDRLIGGGETTTFFGQEGADTFVYRGGTNWVMDFEAGSDRLEIAGLSEAEVLARASQAGDHLHIDLDGGDLYLAWTQLGDLAGHEVLFDRSGDDHLVGTEGDDYLYGGGGDDTLVGRDGDDTLLGGDGDDILEGGDGDDSFDGGAGDDVIRPGDNENGGIFGSTGDDRFVFTGSDTFQWLDYEGLNTGDGITLTIDGAANRASVDKGVAGTDTIEDIVKPLEGNGFGIKATPFDDVFNVTLDNWQWMMIQGGAGNDVFNVQAPETSNVRIDYRNAVNGINIDLGAGLAHDDGFGDVDTFKGDIRSIRGSNHSDTIIGSDRDESFIGRLGVCRIWHTVSDKIRARPGECREFTMSDPFKPVDRDTPYLLPPSLQDWLPQEHLARFVVEIVDRLDLTELERAYGGRGKTPYHPAVMVALLFYGYATGVFSSRKLELATYDSVAFRYITADTHPDHDTIAHFRKRFLEPLRGLFVQILVIAQAMGVLKIGTVSLDGTKVKANASKHKAMSWGYANRLEAQLREEVKTLLEQAARADTEASPGLDIPEELERREARLAAIERAKAEIERRALKRYEAEQAEYEEKLKRRRDTEKATGKKARGREPKAPEPGPRAKDQVNFTDEESRIMPSSEGFVQGYNAQAAVDIDSHVIVAEHVSDHTNDKQELAPALRCLDERQEVVGQPRALLADAGYFSDENVKRCEAEGIEPYIASGRERHHRPLADRLAPVPERPAQADGVAAMGHRMKTPEGRALYAKRKSTVETVFGVIKEVMGFRRFHLRGLEAVQGEWALVCMAWNLKRMHVAVA